MRTCRQSPRKNGTIALIVFGAHRRLLVQPIARWSYPRRRTNGRRQYSSAARHHGGRCHPKSRRIFYGPGCFLLIKDRTTEQIFVCHDCIARIHTIHTKSSCPVTPPSVLCLIHVDEAF